MLRIEESSALPAARLVAANLAVAAAYYLAARVEELLPMAAGASTPVWPAAGVALAGALVWGGRVLPGVWLGAFATNLWLDYQPDARAHSIILCAATALAVMLAAMFSSWAVRRLARDGYFFSGAVGVIGFLVAGGLGFALVSATMGTATLVQFGRLPAKDFFMVWDTWWRGDAIGVFLAAPLLLAWLPSCRENQPPRSLESVVCLALIFVSGFVIFTGNQLLLLGTLPKDVFLALPFFIWASFRLPLRMLTLGIAVFATLAVLGTVTGNGPFQRPSAGNALLVMDAVLAVLVCACLCLAALVRESRANLAALAGSEDKFAKSFRSSPLGVALTTVAEGKFLDVNDRFLAMHGFKNRAEVIGRTSVELGMWLDASEREMLLNRLRLEGRVLNWKRPFRRSSGEVGTGLYSIEMIELAGQECGLFIVNDITENERTEAALRQNELRLRLMAEIIAGYSFSYTVAPDRSLQLEWLSDAGEKVLGYSEAELKGAVRFREQIHPDDRPAHQEKLNLVLAGIPEVMEFRFRTKSGALRWLRSFNRPEWDRHGDRIVRIVGAGQDITDLKSAEADREQLVIQLHRAEDAERRRIARELHDSTAQQLAVLKMNLVLLKKNSPAVGASLDDSISLTDQTIQEVRNFTWLLHPPLLDELGLASALTGYAEGFARRTGLAVTVDKSKFFGRLPAATELALFRVAQESLANILRHAHSLDAQLRLERNSTEANLEIRDHGCGVVVGEIKSGVGIAGMRERLRLVGGTLELESDATGTTVRASVPVAATGVSPSNEPPAGEN